MNLPRRALLGLLAAPVLGALVVWGLRRGPEDIALEAGLAFREGLELDLARPRAPGLHPAVLCVHGGGWVQGGRGQYRGMIEELARRGFVGIAVDYRLPPAHPYPAAVDDVRDALRWATDHAAAYGIDATRIALLGDSAGGHLAALVATTTPGVRAVVCLYGVYDLTVRAPSEAARYYATRFLSGADPAAASPIKHVSAAAPPMLLVHGTADELVPVEQAERFAKQLRAAGAQVETMLIPGAGHAFTGEPARRAWERAGQFLRAELRPAGPP